MKLSILIGIIFGLTSCSYSVSAPRVKTKTEVLYSYKMNRKGTRRVGGMYVRKIGYEGYDKKGNLIEEGKYGEIHGFTKTTQNEDSTSIYISSGHYRDYKNLNTVEYYKIDSLGRKYETELWRYANNKKDYLWYKTLFEYDTKDNITKEIEYDRNNKIFINDYSENKNKPLQRKDTTLNIAQKGVAKFNSWTENIIYKDSLGRPVEQIHYYNGRFSYREERRYSSWGEMVIEIRYDNKPDSLFCITEWQYNYDKQLTRKFRKIIGSKTETKDVYIYDKRKLIVKILHYDGEQIGGYTKFKYKLY